LKDYVAKSWVLTVDGVSLAPEIIEPRLIQSPWESDFDARIVFRLNHRLPPGADVIRGRVTFHLEESGRHPSSLKTAVISGVPREFWSVLQGRGRSPFTREVPVEAPGFELNRRALEVPRLVRWREDFIEGVSFALSRGEVILWSLLLVVSRPEARALIQPMTGAVTGMFLLGVLIPWTAPSGAAWILLSLLGASVWFPSRPRGWWGAVAVASAAPVGLVVSGGATALQITGFSPLLSRPMFALGGLAAGAVPAIMAVLGEVLYRRHYRYLGADVFREQWMFHRRLLATIGAAAALAGFWRAVA
jgi:hypothetical protein